MSIKLRRTIHTHTHHHHHLPPWRQTQWLALKRWYPTTRLTGRQHNHTRINAMHMAAELNPLTAERGRRNLHILCLILSIPWRWLRGKWSVFLDATVCSLLDIYQHFGGMYCVYLQGRMSDDSSTLKTEAIFSSETSVYFYPFNIAKHSRKRFVRKKTT